MNQTASKPQNNDHGMSSFMFGLTLGVLGAFLLGTEEGRKITKQAIDALPDSFKKLPFEPKENVKDFAPPINTPEETQHHVFSTQEAPPPPPPVAHDRPDYLYLSKQ